MIKKITISSVLLLVAAATMRNTLLVAKASVAVQEEKVVSVMEKKVIPLHEVPIVNNEAVKPLAKSELSLQKTIPVNAQMPKKMAISNAERSVLITNNITQDMTTYKKHWTGHYTPSKFIVMVNGQELKQGEPVSVKLTNDIFKMSFMYEFRVFGKVQRAGGKEIEVKLPKDVEKIISTTFSWDNPHNLILDKGEVVKSQEIA